MRRVVHEDCVRLRTSGWRPRICLLLLIVSLGTSTALGNDSSDFDALAVRYEQQIRPLLKQFCLDCHSTEDMEGELDLERFAKLDDVRRSPQPWQKVVEMLGNGEMPPEDSPQLSAEEQQLLGGWVEQYLDAEARASAGDPGPVVLRRLNNSEYTYTIRDLTGVNLDPAREFPVDGAAGEGFTNTGQALAMSPALVQKYLDASKQIAEHVVLLPDGFRFSAGNTRRDWTNEVVTQIRSIYAKHTSGDGDVSGLDRWSVGDPIRATANDGRVEISRYLDALIQHRQQLREDLACCEDIAAETRLNAKYLRLLAEVLVSDEPVSLLLEDLRNRIEHATAGDAQAIAADVGAWQQQLWKNNPVGHFGSIRPWQQPISPVVATQSFRVKIEPPSDTDESGLYLAATSIGEASSAPVVKWQNPRFEFPGQKPILLRDIRALSIALPKLRDRALAETAKYLEAAFEARQASVPRDVSELAAAHNVDGELLRGWLSHLGISIGADVEIDEYLHHPLTGVGGYDFVKGWTLPGLAALSLVGNSSDETAKIPGDMRPHKIVVHPRPERWVAAGWKSPFDGRVKLTPSLQDAHAACGNGVSWSFELRSGNRRRVISSGNVDLGGKAVIEAVADLPVRTGDLVSLIVGPRDGNHGCDLTEIDLMIDEVGGAERHWSLSGDCADTIDAGNPHADRFGNNEVWHFYTGLIDDDQNSPGIAPGSQLAKWLDTSDRATARALAQEIQVLLTSPLPADAPQPDAETHHQLTALGGPLFSQIDRARLVVSVAEDELLASEFGLDPHAFGSLPDDSQTAASDLEVRAGSIMNVRLPASLVAGHEFVVDGALSDAGADAGGVQLWVTTRQPANSGRLHPGTSFVTSSGGAAEAELERAFQDFRNLFPPAMCYARIVPVDEVVTLVLFHREDEHLSRLMLDEAESERLDRLWDELRFVSRDTLTIVTAYEQLMEFATQDDDPSKYEPLRESITNNAAAFRQRLVDAEGPQLNALVDFAARAYRRPLGDAERESLRAFYHELREQPLPHEDAFRLTLARVLASPACLYRLEQPGAGAQAKLVSDVELASRLSYFLWSSSPDADLTEAANNGQLHDAGTLLTQTRRMLRDTRMRRMAVEFACQWLHIRDFDQLDEKSERHFPTFADLRGDMYEESIRFFTDLFQNDGSILTIIDADHTFLNERLAGHYGIPEVTGPAWRRVEGVGKFARGGILAQAATLARQSGASRTSPILRGNWVSETLLGERLPRPPKDVPQLPETVPTGLTERQLIEQHSSVDSCAKCHARIDPYGFALESFDAIGRYRDTDSGGHAIDTQTTLPDGTRLEGIDGLRDYLLTTRRQTFLKQFCRKLLGYALGRGVQLSDEPLLTNVMSRLAENQYRFSIAVEAIVLSDQFRMIRGRRHGDDTLAESSGARSNAPATELNNASERD